MTSKLERHSNCPHRKVGETKTSTPTSQSCFNRTSLDNGDANGNADCEWQNTIQKSLEIYLLLHSCRYLTELNVTRHDLNWRRDAMPLPPCVLLFGEMYEMLIRYDFPSFTWKKLIIKAGFPGGENELWGIKHFSAFSHRCYLHLPGMLSCRNLDNLSGINLNCHFSGRWHQFLSYSKPSNFAHEAATHTKIAYNNQKHISALWGKIRDIVEAWSNIEPQKC